MKYTLFVYTCNVKRCTCNMKRFKKQKIKTYAKAYSFDSPACPQSTARQDQYELL